MHHEEIQEDNTKKNEQLTLLFAHYGRAIYVAQILEQQAIDMVAIDEVVTSKPDSDEAYDMIWSKYDIGKKMMGIMTNLLQEAYQIEQTDMEELKSLLAVKDDLADRYFRFNNLTTASDEDCEQMISDFIAYTQRILAINEKLNVYREAHHIRTNLTEENIVLAFASRK